MKCEFEVGETYKMKNGLDFYVFEITENLIIGKCINDDGEWISADRYLSGKCHTLSNSFDLILPKTPLYKEYKEDTGVNHIVKALSNHGHEYLPTWTYVTWLENKILNKETT